MGIALGFFAIPIHRIEHGRDARSGLDSVESNDARDLVHQTGFEPAKPFGSRVKASPL